MLGMEPLKQSLPVCQGTSTLMMPLTGYGESARVCDTLCDWFCGGSSSYPFMVSEFQKIIGETRRYLL